MSAHTPDDGGPAFPAYINTPNGLVADALQPGMSLRDYFAGQALTGLLAANHISDWTRYAYADHSYAIADAMLEARKGGAE